MNWTQQDERRMAQLERELQELQTRRSEAQLALRVLAQALCAEMDASERVDYVQLWLLEHADTVRDALEPFDNGVRAGVAVCETVHLSGKLTPERAEEITREAKARGLI